MVIGYKAIKDKSYGNRRTKLLKTKVMIIWVLSY